jgi:hypothetical protein
VDVAGWFPGEGVNRWRLEINHLPPSSAVAKKSWRSASILPQYILGAILSKETLFFLQVRFSIITYRKPFE